MITIDERGRRCPLPIIALAKASAEHPSETIALLSDDPAAEHDVPAWCRMKGAVLISTEISGAGARFEIQLPNAP